MATIPRNMHAIYCQLCFAVLSVRITSLSPARLLLQIHWLGKISSMHIPNNWYSHHNKTVCIFYLTECTCSDNISSNICPDDMQNCWRPAKIRRNQVQICGCHCGCERRSTTVLCQDLFGYRDPPLGSTSALGSPCGRLTQCIVYSLQNCCKFWFQHRKW